MKTRYFKCPNCNNITPELGTVMFCARCAIIETTSDGHRIRRQYKMSEIGQQA